MKFKKLVAIALFLLPISIYAQDTTYFDINWKKVKLREQAKYYEVLRTDSVFTIGQEVNYFDKSGKELKSLESADFYSIILHELEFPGRKIERQFTLNGKLKIEKHFFEVQSKKEKDKIISKLDGNYKEWFDNGQLKVNLNYKNDSLVGALHTYWPTGQLKRDDNYENGKSSNGKCFNVDGNEIEYFPYQVMPEYPGGVKALLNYISKNLKYPVEMQMQHIQGKVVVRFVVTKEGTISKTEVVKSVSPEIDSEAVRVIKNLSKWKPGMQDGELISVWYTLPITFKLE